MTKFKLTLLGLVSAVVMNGCAHHGYAAPIVAGAIVGASAVALTTPHYGYNYNYYRRTYYRPVQAHYYTYGPQYYADRNRKIATGHYGGHKGAPRRY